MNKVVRDGQVAVIVSPSYGAGWYSWNTKCRALLFDPQLVAAVEAGDAEAVKRRADELNPGGHHSVDSLQVRWVPEGAVFRVDEYDGNERLVMLGDDDWITA